MTLEEAIRKMREQYGNGDEEDAHAKADEILLEYLRANGAAELAAAFDTCRETVGFWYA